MAKELKLILEFAVKVEFVKVHQSSMTFVMTLIYAQFESQSQSMERKNVEILVEN